jgi:hypothetical protein
MYSRKGKAKWGRVWVFKGCTRPGRTPASALKYQIQTTENLSAVNHSSFSPPIQRQVYTTVLKAGINVCANQKLNTSFGPVINNFGVKPLKKLEKPSFLAILLRILKPDSGFSKFRFWIRVLMTSSGAETMRDADAPATEATKFWPQVAAL